MHERLQNCRNFVKNEDVVFILWENSRILTSSIQNKVFTENRKEINVSKKHEFLAPIFLRRQPRAVYCNRL